MNYNNEQHRFGQVGRQWNLIHERGSSEWKALIKELLEYDFIIDPTMTAYVATRDVMRAQTAVWHEKYTLPSLWTIIYQAGIIMELTILTGIQQMKWHGKTFIEFGCHF